MEIKNDQFSLNAFQSKKRLTTKESVSVLKDLRNRQGSFDKDIFEGYYNHVIDNTKMNITFLDFLYKNYGNHFTKYTKIIKRKPISLSYYLSENTKDISEDLVFIDPWETRHILFKYNIPRLSRDVYSTDIRIFINQKSTHEDRNVPDSNKLNSLFDSLVAINMMLSEKGVTKKDTLLKAKESLIEILQYNDFDLNNTALIVESADQIKQEKRKRKDESNN